MLRAAHPDLLIETLAVDTLGDRTQSSNIALHTIGGQGVFVKEVQAAVLDGRADFAVHSAKDLPSRATDGLVLGAFPLRGDPRDALVGSTLAGLAIGARIATGSVRRRAQLAAVRPDLVFHELRGNMATRVAKAADFDAVVAGVAGLTHIGLDGHITERLDPAVMLPQVAQGALAVECRSDDDVMVEWLRAIDDAAVRACVSAERAYLERLGSGCDLPVGGLCVIVGTSSLRLTALISSRDGSTVLRRERMGAIADPIGLGRGLAALLLTEGGGELLRRR